MIKLKWFFCLIFIFVSAADSADLELKTKKIGKKVSLDPFDSVWNKVKSVEIPLMPQHIAPPGGGGSVAKIWIKGFSLEKSLIQIKQRTSTLLMEKLPLGQVRKQGILSQNVRGKLLLRL